jgi:PDZ domain-containing protein
MNRRAVTFGVAAFLLAGLLITAARLPVPYVVLSPGPVTDTLGDVPHGEGVNGSSGGPVIRISGAKTQPSTGHLFLTTVGVLPGSCSAHPPLLDAIKAWFSSTKTVEPQQVQCPPGESSQAVQQQGIDEMAQSQNDAIYAALTELGYKSTGNAVFVESVDSGVPAASVLRADDEILTVDGTRVARPEQVVNVVQRARPGTTITMVVRRADGRHDFRVRTTTGSNGKSRLGVTVASRPTFNGINVTIGIDPNAIQGPSAGTALALGIIDKLTPGGITGGRTIAGTGTIDRAGKVGPIGGIQQKVAAAVAAHATVFFAPASECSGAKAAAPASLTLVSVKTLRGAVLALEAIKSGSTAFPHC